MKREEVKIGNRGYDVCNYWCAFTFDNPIRKYFHNPEKMFKDYLKKGMKVMDFGCGMGYFSIGMAKLLGKGSKIYSVDLQEKMLSKVNKRARYYKLEESIITHRCEPNSINLDERLDFVLCFWMLHEVPDYKQCLKNIYELLTDDAKLFIAEPGIHVKQKDFDDMVKIAFDLGFKVDSYPKVKLSYAIVLKK